MIVIIICLTVLCLPFCSDHLGQLISLARYAIQCSAVCACICICVALVHRSIVFAECFLLLFINFFQYKFVCLLVCLLAWLIFFCIFRDLKVTEIDEFLDIVALFCPPGTVGYYYNNILIHSL